MREVIRDDDGTVLAATCVGRALSPLARERNHARLIRLGLAPEQRHG